MQSLSSLKDDYECVLPIKGAGFVVRVTLMKPNLM